MGIGAWSKRIGLSGLTWAGMKHHYAIIPVLIIDVIGFVGAAGYVIRLATKSPEVSWNRKANPEPWNDYANKQYKFLSSGRDYSIPSPAPKYK